MRRMGWRWCCDEPGHNGRVQEAGALTVVSLLP